MLSDSASPLRADQGHLPWNAAATALGLTSRLRHFEPSSLSLYYSVLYSPAAAEKEKQVEVELLALVMSEF